jgi:hypothetical protein
MDLPWEPILPCLAKVRFLNLLFHMLNCCIGGYRNRLWETLNKQGKTKEMVTMTMGNIDIG